jgi:hypothetical protein
MWQDHHYKECWYITPSTPPKGWNGKPEIFDRINEAKPRKLEWFKTDFKYDGLDKGTKATDGPPPNSAISGTENANQPNTPRVTAVTAHTSFTKACTGEYKLYNCWMIDNATNIHVCNDARRSGFRKTRDSKPDNMILTGKTTYPVEA